MDGVIAMTQILLPKCSYVLVADDGVAPEKLRQIFKLQAAQRGVEVSMLTAHCSKAFSLEVSKQVSAADAQEILDATANAVQKRLHISLSDDITTGEELPIHGGSENPHLPIVRRQAIFHSRFGSSN